MKRFITTVSGMIFLCVMAFLFSAEESVTEQNKVSVKTEDAAVHAATNQTQTPKTEAIAAASASGDQAAFNADAKRQTVVNLVERGVEFIKNNTLEAVGKAFTHTKDFIEGELYLFLLDTKGVVYAHGDQSYLLWKNLWDYRDSFGALMVQSIINGAKKGPSWITYEWNGAVKVSYVQLVEKDNKEYVIGAGYFPHSKEYAVLGLVKGAVALFEQAVADKKPVGDVFSAISYPLSNRFVFGDLYLYALDFEGEIQAQGDRPGLIGTNALDYQDSKGVFINKEIIEKLKEKEVGTGIWIEYMSKNALKKAYAEKVVDGKGRHYFIACGYYPDITRNDVINLVRRGYQLMKGSGKSVAANEFTDKKVNAFRQGDLYLFIYDMKGVCVAHGETDDYVGQNHFDLKDQNGRYYVREFIDQAKSGGGWVDVKIYNSFESVYVEKIDMGIEEFLIGSGTFPVSKADTMSLLVKSSIGYLKSHTEEASLEQFVARNGEFIRGDLFLYVLDNEGYCWAWGDSYALIWQNLLNWKDESGALFIKDIIEKAKEGPDTITYPMNKGSRVTYFEQIEKGGETYIVGSGFYK